MTTLELMEALSAANIKGGWVVRDGKIVLWENAEAVPDEFKEFLELD